MGQINCRRLCRRKRPDDFTFSNAFLEELKMISNYSERELEKVYETFKKMDLSGTGQLSKEDFLKYRQNIHKKKKALPQDEKVQLPMEDRLWLLFDPTNKGHVTFRQFVEVTSAMSLQGPRDLKIRFAFKMIDFDNDGKINASDIKEYLMRITKLSQTKENVKAYKRARDQALQLDKAHEEEDASEMVRQFSQKNEKEKNRHLRHRRLQAARTRGRTGRNLSLVLDQKDGDASAEGGADKKEEEKESKGKKQKAPLTKTRSVMAADEAAEVESLRIELIEAVATTVIEEAAPNKHYLTLQDFSKVVETDTEFFSHMNLYL